MKNKTNYLDSRSPEEREEDSKIKAETTTSTSKETLREKIMNIASVPPDHEGGTGYLKLTDEEIDKILKVCQEKEKETLEELLKMTDLYVGDVDDCKREIKGMLVKIKDEK